MYGNYDMLPPYHAQRREFEELEAAGRVKRNEEWFLQYWISQTEQRLFYLRSEAMQEERRAETIWKPIKESFAVDWFHADRTLDHQAKEAIERKAMIEKEPIFRRHRKLVSEIEKLSVLLAAYEERLSVIEAMMVPEHI